MQQYFEDIELVSPGIYRNYRGHISGRTPLVYSVEFLASGRMYLHQDSCPERVLDTPTLRWQTPGHMYSYGPVDEVGWEHYFIAFQGPRAERLCQGNRSRRLFSHGPARRLRNRVGIGAHQSQNRIVTQRSDIPS
jgi:hypothetical protein